MANRNTIRTFQPLTNYHIYNRGVAKQAIFLDQKDYEAFIRRLQLIFLPLDDAENLQHNINRIRINNFHQQVLLQAYCLMPNHFHLMFKSGDNADAVSAAMRTLATSYAMYFNAKYDRVGPVFQGKFKAAHVDNEPYLLHLSRYIHCNPRTIHANIFAYPYSSLQYYFKTSKPGWIESKEIEELFASEADYVSFVNDLQDLQSAAEKYEI